MQDLHTLGGDYSLAAAINATGQVVGQSTVTGLTDLHAFRWDSATGMMDLGTLAGASDSRAYGLNNQGQIVGSCYFLSLLGSHAFRWSDGTMTDVNDELPPDSGWTVQSATGINDVGQVVGFGKNPDGQTHGFLLTPDDSPAVHSQPRLDPLAAQRLATHSALVPAVLETTLPDSGQLANVGQRVAADTGVQPLTQPDQSAARLSTSIRRYATDAAGGALGRGLSDGWTSWESDPLAGGLR
jgi:probable HAF family extracellular repeat protein